MPSYLITNANYFLLKPKLTKIFFVVQIKMFFYLKQVVLKLNEIWPTEPVFQSTKRGKIILCHLTLHTSCMKRNVISFLTMHNV